jgi:hypothetical protein
MIGNWWFYAGTPAALLIKSIFMIEKFGNRWLYTGTLVVLLIKPKSTYGMFIPDPGSEYFPSRKSIRGKFFQVFLTQKIVSKLSEISGSGSRFFTLPGSRIQESGDKKGSGSRIWIRNTDI